MKALVILCLLGWPPLLFAQDSTVVQTGNIDPSKPTNLYTQVNMALEYQNQLSQNLFGVRVNVQYALNPDNLFLVEAPFLYNDRTSTFGLGDIRIRYFNAVKRNISRSLIAVAPFADVSIPSGSFKNGLGSSSWSVAGGVVAGVLVSPKLSLFPGVSYVHITKARTDLIPETAKFSSDGIGLQFNISYRFNSQTFLFINPLPTFLHTNSNWDTVWAGEFNLNHIVKPNKFKVNIGWFPNFTAEAQVVRLGGTFFL